MYQFSRSIYRELVSHVVDSSANNGGTAKQEVLDACEATMRRLAFDRRYFARPARTLFIDVRSHFPIHEQHRVHRVIDKHIELALEYLDQLPDDVGLDGRPRQCRASTRKGKPCQREPLPGRDYCPSHKHLEEESLGELSEVGAAA